VIDLDGFMRDRYSEAVAEVGRVDGEDDFTHRMRVMSYLHLTRFVRILLDRKDRMSMAVGLEVRVPFCDHRLVEYVYNTPWSLKTYDGREKSLLRGAARDVLPQSVVDRVKSPYPSAVRCRDPGACQGSIRVGRRPAVHHHRSREAGTPHRAGPAHAPTCRPHAPRTGAGPGGVDRHVQADDRLLIV
jgi:asparagine synthetase B (glutamine-hydrolysing)